MLLKYNSQLENIRNKYILNALFEFMRDAFIFRVQNLIAKIDVYKLHADFS